MGIVLVHRRLRLVEIIVEDFDLKFFNFLRANSFFPLYKILHFYNNLFVSFLIVVYIMSIRNLTNENDKKNVHLSMHWQLAYT